MPVLKVKKNGVWEDIMGGSAGQSMNGGNADTLDGKHADEFALADDIVGLATETFVTNKITEAQLSGGSSADMSQYATKDELTEMVGDTNVATQISNAISSIDYPVDSVNGKSGAVTLTASDVGALPETTVIPSIDGLASEPYVDDKFDSLVGDKSVVEQIEDAIGTHNHDDTYYTELEIDAKLANKVDAISGSRLITDSEAAKLEALVVGDNGEIGVSGKVSAENVDGLSELLTNKVDVVSGKGLSTNDYTTTEKNKLAGIDEGANKTVVDSALNSSSTNPVQNKVVQAALSNLNTLVGDKSVSEQISIAIANKSEIGHKHDSDYDAKGAADSALASAKTYADSAAATIKNDLLNGAGAAYDTLKELGDLIDDNVDAIEALEIVAANKANSVHNHAISDIDDLQNRLNAKVDVTRTINKKALSVDITLSASDVGADAIGAADTAYDNATKYTNDEIAKFTGGKTVAASIEDAIKGIVHPVTSVNGKTGAVSLSASDVSAVPTTRTINGQALSSDVTISIPDSLSDLSSDSTHRTVTDAEKSAWNEKSNFSGNYNDLTNKPTIPDAVTVDSALSSSSTNPVQNKVVNSAISNLNALVGDTEVSTQISNAIAGKANSGDLAKVATSGSYDDLSNKPTIPSAYSHPASHPASMITDLATVATSGSYNDLSDKPTIPSAYSHPNSGVTAGTYKSVTVNAQGHVTGGSNPTTLSGYGITDAVTSTYFTSIVGDTKVSTQIANAISGKANNSDLAAVAKSGNYNDLSNRPTKVSELTNDSNYTTATGHTHDNRYYTETEIDTKLAAKANVLYATVQTTSFADIQAAYKAGSLVFAKQILGTTQMIFPLVALFENDCVVFESCDGRWVCDSDGTWTTTTSAREKISALESLLSITFTVSGTTYNAIRGMTWAEFIDSEYNTGGFYVNSSSNKVMQIGYAHISNDQETNYQKPYDVIGANVTYYYLA